MCIIYNSYGILLQAFLSELTINSIRPDLKFYIYISVLEHYLSFSNSKIQTKKVHSKYKRRYMCDSQSVHCNLIFMQLKKTELFKNN